MRWVALLVLLAGPGAAQQIAQTAQVLTLDQDRLFAESRFGRAVAARVEAETQALAAENRKIDAALEAEERDLTERRATTEPAAFRALGAAFDAKAEDLREAQRAKGRGLIRSREEERQLFSQAVGPVLAELMTDKGALVILDDSAVVLSFSRIDVTDDAIARLDAVLGDGSNRQMPQALPLPLPEPESPPIPRDPAPSLPAP